MKIEKWDFVEDNEIILIGVKNLCRRLVGDMFKRVGLCCIMNNFYIKGLFF